MCRSFAMRLFSHEARNGRAGIALARRYHAGRLRVFRELCRGFGVDWQMNRAVYSESSRKGSKERRNDARKVPAQPESPENPVEKPRERAWRRIYRRHEKALLVLAGALVSFAIVLGHAELNPMPAALTQDDIDRAV